MQKAIYAIKLKFFKIFPTPQMLNRLHLDYIHFGHGIDETNHRLPHSHLLETLEVETVPLADHHKVAYIRMMPKQHFEDFINYGADASFHAHGLEDGKPEDELDLILQLEERWLGRVFTKFILVGTALMFCGSLLLLTSSQTVLLY